MSEIPTLSAQRSEQGLFSPSPAAKKAIWAGVKLGSAGIKAGYKPLPTARRAHAADSRMVCISGGWRAGKAEALDTPIPTPFGWKTMGEMEVGDEVFDEQGRPSLVTGVSPIWENRPRYRVLFSDGTSIVADAEHDWLTSRNTGHKPYRRSFSVRTTEKMSQISLRAGKNRYLRLPDRAGLQCDEADLPIDPYVLGVWLGDGGALHAEITSADQDVVDELSRRGEEMKKLKAKYRWSAKGLRLRLRAAGLEKNKHIPPAYLRASFQQRLDLLRGMMDTDGGVGNGPEFYNTDRGLVDGVLELVRSLGMYPRVSEKRAMLYGKDCGPVWTVNFQTELQVFLLPRKAGKLSLAPRRMMSIVSVERVEDGPTRCIEVDTPSHLFLSGEGMVPSHNSLTSGMEALSWLPYADLIWFVAKDYDLSRQEFGYLMEGAISAGLARPHDCHMPETRYQPCVMRGIPSKWSESGCVVETRTLSDIRKLAAKPPDLVVVCEPGLIDNLKLVEELLWGRVSERRGMIWMAGTSDEASEEWWEIWTRCNNPDSKVNVQGGRSFSIPTWQNLHRYPLGDQEREFEVYKELYGEEALMAHFGGVPASPRDLVLRGYWGDHLLDPDALWTPNRPTEIAIDPGYASHYAIEVIQTDLKDGRSIYLVDEIAEQGKTHDEMKELCKEKPWWKHIQGGTSDPHTESHIFGGYPTTLYWPEIPLRVQHKQIKVNTTVHSLKESMALDGDHGPRLHVNPEMVKRFPWEAKHWRVDKYGRPSTQNCDATKALGYWLVDKFMEERAEGQEEDNIVSGKEWQFDPA